MNKKIRFKIYRLFGIFFVLLFTESCSNTFIDNKQRSDPLEQFNRRIFDFNYHILDRHIIRPLAIVWRDYLPMPVRNSLSNFLYNLEEPASMVNNFLCGNIFQGIKHFNRFFLNSVFGIAGLVDIASMANPKLAKEETNRFGSTLGYYRVGYGPYIVLPGYGSFTLREDFGNLVDTTYPVLSYLTFWMSIGKWLLEGIENRALLLDFTEILQNSSDPYLIIIESYFQNKDFKAQRNAFKPIINFNSAIIEGNLNSVD
ncbi:MAG: MlaA family lipoprotein [Arsenophonus sp.]